MNNKEKESEEDKDFPFEIEPVLLLKLSEKSRHFPNIRSYKGENILQTYISLSSEG